MLLMFLISSQNGDQHYVTNYTHGMCKWLQIENAGVHSTFNSKSFKFHVGIALQHLEWALIKNNHNCKCNAISHDEVIENYFNFI